jgi:shikimate kinase
MNIVLIGFMASGKTTIGQALACQLNLKFIDTDEYIEGQQNMEIKDIFSQFGETHFRLLEKQAIEQLEGFEGYVISVGGGAVMYHNNLDTLKRIGVTVFLDTPLQKILVNLKSKFRPLVGNTIDENKMKELLEYRYPTYKKAEIIINTDMLDAEQTVKEICQRLDLYKE